MIDDDWSVSEVIDKFQILGILPHTIPNAIGLWPNEQECLVWCACKSNPNTNWVEIGSFCGGSTILLGLAKNQFMTDSKVLAIDTAFNPIFDLNIKRSKLQNIVKIEDHSFQALQQIQEPVGFLFLDGWHSFKNVVIEFETILQNLTDSAIIVFHDVSPQMYTHDKKYIKEKYEYTQAHWNSLINNIEEDFRLDEAVSYICYEYNYKIIDIPIRQKLAYHKETGLNNWVRGKTSPHNALTAIRKII